MRTGKINTRNKLFAVMKVSVIDRSDSLILIPNFFRSNLLICSKTGSRRYSCKTSDSKFSKISGHVLGKLYLISLVLTIPKLPATIQQLFQESLGLFPWIQWFNKRTSFSALGQGVGIFLFNFTSFLSSLRETKTLNSKSGKWQ